MTPTHEKCLDAFPTWLRNLGEDSEKLAGALRDPAVPGAARNSIAGALTYLFKSIDLIPDGIDDIGYLDDAFVIRVASAYAIKEAEDAGGATSPIVEALADDCTLVREFLGADYGRLESYVRTLRNATARGRSVDDVLGDDAVLDAFISDVRGFARGYQPPGFRREERILVKLRAFLDAKLPR